MLLLVHSISQINIKAFLDGRRKINRRIENRYLEIKAANYNIFGYERSQNVHSGVRMIRDPS